VKYKIPFNKPFIVGKELYNIAQAVQQGRLSGDGEFTRRCHAWLESHLGCHKALLTHSGTGALEMAAHLCGMQPGDEVIMPSFTFVSTANAFVSRGAVPVFVDIRPDTLNIDEQKIAAAIGRRTKAILVVHYGGIACAMDTIMKLAARHNLWVVEDAAQALLCRDGERCLGTIGHLGCLSFHETKNIISGEGGAFLINVPELVERAEILWEKGTDRKKFYRGEVDKYTWVDLGSSYLPSELTAAFLMAQFDEAQKIIEVRKRLFAYYRKRLKPLADQGIFQIPAVADHHHHNGHLFYLLLASQDQRSRLINYLKQAGVYAVFHYVPLHSSPAGKRFGRVAGGEMTVTDRISERLLRLPLYFEMTPNDIDFVVAQIESFFETESHL
jgi:dTDP-4-amino-4,6-dideoxygalactose transaminase